jgi:hypothetical protein
MTARRRQGRQAAMIASMLLLAGCSFRTESLGERCGDLMQAAFPDAEIEITGRTASAEMASGTARVEGTRSDVQPGGRMAREIAVECSFEDGILTGFRWVTGPLR